MKSNASFSAISTIVTTTKTLMLFLSFSVLSITANAQNYAWAAAMRGIKVETCSSIALDNDGNVYTTGHFYGTTDFNPGSGTANLISAGVTDIFISKLDASGHFVWAKRIGGTGRDVSNGIVVDTLGNVYITGYFEGTADFDPGAGTANLTSAGMTDIFISKLDTSGNLVWVKNIGGAGYDVATDIALDNLGNIYTTGSFDGNTDFDPNMGTAYLTAVSTDLFIHKLDASGNYVWAKRIGGTGVDAGQKIDVDAWGNVVIMGYFNSTVDFDPGSGVVNLTSIGNSNSFVSKLDALGNYVWVITIGALNGQSCSDICVDDLGQVYITGGFSSNMDGDPGLGGITLYSAGQFDIFIMKLDALSNCIWAKSVGGTENDYSRGIGVDILGNVYITGAFNGTADFDPSAGTANVTSVNNLDDIFISKLDVLGNYVWAKGIGGASYDMGTSIALDGLGNVYTVGGFQGSVDFNPNAGVANLSAAGDYDIFICKLQNTNVAVKDILLNNTFSIYPNPTKDIVTIAIPTNFSESYLLEVYNLQGQLVRKGEVTNLTILDMKEITTGTYLFILKNEEGNVVFKEKIIKE